MVYDPDGDGNVRLELRSLPAGPTTADMVANAAFLVGLTLALTDHSPWMTAALPFRYAEHNFMEAARHGLDATLLWPAELAPSPRPEPVARMLPALVDLADRGLAGAGVGDAERDAHLGLVRRRIAAGVTGSRWQRRTVVALEGAMGRDAAVAEMLRRYLDLAAAGAPVHTWPEPANGVRPRAPA